MYRRKNIGELLIELGKISKDDLEEGLKKQKEFNLRLGETLVKLGKIKPEDIEWVLSKQLDIPFVIVEDVILDTKLINKFSKDLLIRNRILPIYETEDEIAIATDDPLNTEIFNSIEIYFGKKIKVSSANGEKIEEILREFFKKGSTPNLITYIENLLEKLKETSFYRIDFILREYSTDVNVYGANINKKMEGLSSSYTIEQIFEAFESLNVNLLFEHCKNSESQMLFIYPLANYVSEIHYPAIISKFGLFIPQQVLFTDLKSFNLTSVFYSENPVYGYPFFSTKNSHINYNYVVFTVDSAPQEFKDYYIDIIIPKKCNCCSGKGCKKCEELGYVFTEKVEGIYSSNEFINILNKIKNGKDR